MTIRYLSLFSGVDAASLAWEPRGWQCVGFSEIEKHPCRVLAHRWPHVPNLGDVTKITEAQIAALGRIDVLVFGSPCQDLSIAGKRKGLAGERSGLFFDAMRIAGWARRWGGLRFALWENVFGAFSSNEGRDFAAVVAEMAGLDHVDVPQRGPKKGWGNEGCAVGDDALVEWGCLDAQWFGVAQRRRRVFALADFGDWSNRPPILLEPQSMRGDSAPSRGEGERVANCLGASPSTSCCPNVGSGQGTVVDVWALDVFNQCSTGAVSKTVSARDDQGTASVIAFNSNAQPDQMAFDPHVSAPLTCSQYSAVAREDGAGRWTPLAAGVHPPASAFPANLSGTQCASAEDLAPSMGAKNPTAIAFSAKEAALKSRCGNCNCLAQCGDVAAHEAGVMARQPTNSVFAPVAFTTEQTPKFNVDCALTLTKQSPSGGGQIQSVLTAMQVRRLTPIECERLQGMPDNHTQVPYGNKPAEQCPDGPRYKAIGNSKAVPVVAHIGQRIEFVLNYF